jgi:hypothetical protein
VLRWLAGGGFLIAVAGLVLSETLLAPKYELAYRGGVDAAHCTAIGRSETCSFGYGLAIGNNGKGRQERVRILWPLDLSGCHVEWQVSDIVAQVRPTPQPQILTALEAGRTVHTIEALMPDTMVEFELGCGARTRDELRAMSRKAPKVEARGAVSEADPRASAFWHAVTNLLRVFGLFG